MVTASEKQVEQFKASPPPILVWDNQQPWQTPRYEVRYFHRRKIEVWHGYVQTKNITGWVSNVRIALFVEKWQRDHGGAPPTNDDILHWMLRDRNEEFDLLSLAESIVKNGVRQPIVVTSAGVLLDGNRRYFAALMKLREAEKNGDKSVLTMVSQLPAYVLSPICSEEDFESVLVEENFVDDCRIEWPNYIKASKVFEAYQELREGDATKTVALTRLTEQFGIKRAHVDRFIKVMNFIQEFHEHHVSEDEETGRRPKEEYEIKWKEQKYFEYFDELSKTKVVKALDANPEFAAKVFDRLYDEEFENFTWIRKLPEIAADTRARDIFMTGTGSKAIKDAMQWVTITGAAKKAMDINDRITSFERFLESLNAHDISTLDPLAVKALEEIAENVARMAKAVSRKR